MRRALYVSIFVATFLPLFAFAQNPAITSYRASETSINSGQAISFSWTLTNAGGYSLFIPCINGIILKNADGSSRNCNSVISTTAVVNDSIILIIYNVSGSAKYVTVRLTPKTATGADYSAASQEVNVSVQTLAQPITKFTADQTDTSSQQAVNISWDSQIINGVNLQTGCRSEITVSSPSYPSLGSLPCGKMIFPNDLGTSGSLALFFKNSSSYPVPFTLELYPSVVANTSYDGTHAVTLALNVASDILPDPIVTYFSASTTAITSGDKVTLSWGSRYTVGTNIKFSCNNAITATSTAFLIPSFPCNTYLFDPLLAPIGDTALIFLNSSNQDQAITIMLIPSAREGIYDALREKNLSLIIRPVIASTPLPSLSPFPSSAVTPAVSISPLISPSVLPFVRQKTIFTQYLKRGSSGAQVSALQEFLKKDVMLYPEGQVTGYLGPATERSVKRFQTKYGIVISGTPATTGYGALGPKTREKLNSL